MTFGAEIINSDGSTQLDGSTKTFYVIQTGTLAAQSAIYGPPTFSTTYTPSGLSGAGSISFPSQTSTPLIVFNGGRVSCAITSSTTAWITWQGGPIKYAVLSPNVPPHPTGFGLDIMDSSGNSIYTADFAIFTVDSVVTSTNSSYYMTAGSLGPTTTGQMSNVDTSFSSTTLSVPTFGERFSTANYYVYRPQTRMNGYWSNGAGGTGWRRGSFGSSTVGNVVRSALVVYEEFTALAQNFQFYENPAHQIISGYLNI